MPLFANRVQETTTTSGTGTLTLAGAVTGYRTFAASFSNADVVFYTIDDGAGNWEVGYGTYNTGTLSRSTVINSSNADALVSFGAGSKRVFSTAPSRVLLPDQTSASGKFLTSNGTAASWSTVPNAGLANSTITFGATSAALGTTVSGFNAVSIGAGTPSTGAFTTLSASSTVSFSPAATTVTLSPTGTGGGVTISPSGTGSVTINPTTAGTINNMSIGATTRSTGAFTTLTANSTVTLSPTSANVLIQPTGTGVVTINPATAGSMNNMVIGGTTPAAATFSSITNTGYGVLSGGAGGGAAIQGTAGNYPSTGKGLEFAAAYSGSNNLIQSYDRDGAAYMGQHYNASSHGFYISGAFAASLTSTVLGLFTTPKGWAVNTVDIGGCAFYAVPTSPLMGLSCGAYYDGAWKYAISSTKASLWEMNGGDISYLATNTTGTAGGTISFTTNFVFTAAGNFYPKAGAASMTNGFVYIPSGAGAAGTPALTPSGTVPLYCDTSGNRIGVYYGGSWKYTAVA